MARDIMCCIKILPSWDVCGVRQEVCVLGVVCVFWDTFACLLLNYIKRLQQITSRSRLRKHLPGTRRTARATYEKRTPLRNAPTQRSSAARKSGSALASAASRVSPPATLPAGAASGRALPVGIWRKRPPAASTDSRNSLRKHEASTKGSKGEASARVRVQSTYQRKLRRTHTPSRKTSAPPPRSRPCQR